MLLLQLLHVARRGQHVADELGGRLVDVDQDLGVLEGLQDGHLVEVVALGAARAVLVYFGACALDPRALLGVVHVHHARRVELGHQDGVGCCCVVSVVAVVRLECIDHEKLLLRLLVTCARLMREEGARRGLGLSLLLLVAAASGVDLRESLVAEIEVEKVRPVCHCRFGVRLFAQRRVEEHLVVEVVVVDHGLGASLILLLLLLLVTIASLVRSRARLNRWWWWWHLWRWLLVVVIVGGVLVKVVVSVEELLHVGLDLLLALHFGEHVVRRRLIVVIVVVVAVDAHQVEVALQLLLEQLLLDLDAAPLHAQLGESARQGELVDRSFNTIFRSNRGRSRAPLVLALVVIRKWLFIRVDKFGTRRGDHRVLMSAARHVLVGRVELLEQQHHHLLLLLLLLR